MAIPGSVLDEAYYIYEEFGPSRQMDRGARLKNVFPELSPDEIMVVLRHMDEVTQTVWKLAEQGGETKLGRQKVLDLLQQAHPFLREKGLDCALARVNYYAWHEGYDR